MFFLDIIQWDTRNWFSSTFSYESIFSQVLLASGWTDVEKLFSIGSGKSLSCFIPQLLRLLILTWAATLTQNPPMHLMQFDCTTLSFPKLCKYGSEHFRELPLESPQLACYPLVTGKVIVTLHLFSKLLDISQKSIAVWQLVISIDFNGNHCVLKTTISTGSKAELKREINSLIFKALVLFL